MSDTKRRISDLLPEVLQTDILRKFFAATADHLFQPEKVEYLNNYIGRMPSWYNPKKDFYVVETSKSRQDYQVEATAISRSQGSDTVSHILFYEDLLNKLRSQGALVNDHNRLFEQEYYSFGLPCDVDMWLNFQEYVWLSDGPDTITLLDITDLSSVSNESAYVYAGTYAIANNPSSIINGATHPLVFSTGLKIKPTLDLDIALRDRELIIEGVGRKIYFVDDTDSSIKIRWDNPKEYDSTPWDGVDKLVTPAYVVMHRGSSNQNPWSIRNRWFHRDVLVQSQTLLQDVNALVAKYPIICFDKTTKLWNFGTIGRGRVTVVDSFTTDLGSLIGRSQSNSNPLLVDGISLDDGMTILFTNLVDGQANNRIYRVSGLRSDNKLTLQLLPNQSDVTGAPKNNDSLYVASGNPLNRFFDTYLRFQSSTNSWVSAQSWKQTVDSQSPLFELFDIDGNSLSDPSIYPLSSFSGSSLFSYDPSQLAAINQGSLLVSANELTFENTLSQNTWTYQPNNLRVDISGFKFWQTVDPVTTQPVYQNNWFKSPVLSRQYVVNQFYTQESQKTFTLDQAPGTGAPGPSAINVEVSGVLLTPDQYTVSGKVLTLANSVQPNSNVVVKTWQNITNIATTGYFEIPKNLEANPNNLEVSTITRQNIINHLITVIGNQSNIIGNIIGANNWRDTAQNQSLGTVILQHRAPLLKTMILNSIAQTSALTSSNALLDPIGVMQWSQKEYLRFYNKYINSLVNLFNSGGLTLANPISEWLDKALKSINVGKTLSSPWAMSGFDGVPGRYCSEKSITPTFVPASATRLGVTPSFVPTAFFDVTQPNSPLSLRCHNGAVVVLQDFNGADLGTIADQQSSTVDPQLLTHPVARAWMQLEVNLFNSLPASYRNPDSVQKLDIKTIFSGKWRTTNYSYKDQLTMLYPVFERWLTTNQLDAFKNTTYKIDDPFSWNYSSCTDQENNPVPGHWRGIYFLFFDTDRPNSCPWEMLGFSQQPLWWNEEYGAAPYTSGNTQLWYDLRDGRIRQGQRQGIDPAYARPGLMQYLPVDEFGQLLPPGPARIVTTLPSEIEARADWKFGDRGPLENVWLTAVDSDQIWAQIGYLAKPAQFIEYLWDGPRAQQIFATQTNSQWVWKDYRKRISNSDIFVHREDPQNVTTLSSDLSYYGSCGIQHWISEYLINDSRSVTEYFGNVIRNSDVTLGYRAGGFIDGTSVKLLVDSFGLSSNDSLLIPQEDVTNNLIRSASLKEFFYSGVIVEYRGSEGYRVIGYDSYDPNFYVIPSNLTGPKTTVIVDKIKVIEYKLGLPSVKKVPYGTILPTQQDVFDFLVSLGRWQVSQGWIFDEYSSTTGQLQDWSLSGREFLFWSQGPWAAGNYIALSPLALKTKFVTSFGTIQNIGGIVNGSYTILDRGGRPIQVQNIDFLRIDDQVSVRPLNDQGIFGIRLYTTGLEHALLFQNKTIFGDIVYDPLFDVRQSRFKIQTYKSMDWAGRLEAPGYLVTQTTSTIGDRIIVNNQILANFEKTVDDIRKLYNIDVPTPYNYSDSTGMHTNATSALSQALPKRYNMLATHLVGYQQREYLTNLLVDETTQFQFYQGMIKQKGTKGTIDSLLRNTQLVDANESFSYYEEYAFRLGTYGSNELIHGIDVLLLQTEVRSNPQLVEFFSGSIEDLAYDDTITITPKDSRVLYKSEATPNFSLRSHYGSAPGDLPNSGYVLFSEATYYVKDQAELFSLAQTLETKNTPLQAHDRVWQFIDTAIGWNIYKVCRPAWQIQQTTPVTLNQTTISTSLPHNLQNGNILVLSGVTGVNGRLDGTFSVFNVTRNTFDVQATTAAPGANGQVLQYWSIRFPTYAAFNNATPPGGWTQRDFAYVDGNQDEPWKVYQKYGVWFEYRREDKKVDTSLLLTSTLYNKTTLQTLAHLNIWDPSKGALPGLVNEEVTYRTHWDPASYNAGDSRLYQVDPSTAWGPNQVGQTWWDLSTTRFIDYEIGTDSYRRRHWGQIAPGISIDIYEWIRSLVPPSSWAGAVTAGNSAATGGDQTPTGSVKGADYPYVLASERNESGQYTNAYYFWVKNKTTVPNVPDRKISVASLSQIVESPQTQNQSWWAAISSTGALLANIGSFLDENNTVWQVNYTSRENVDKIYKEWTLLRPNDPLSTPTPDLWSKMCDSLVEFNNVGNSVPNLRLPEMSKYGMLTRPSQSWFKDGITARRAFVKKINSLLSSSSVPPLDDPDRLGWLQYFQSVEPQPLQKNTKANARVATTTALDTVYYPGENGKGATLTYNGSSYSALVVDGITVNLGDRIIVKNQNPVSLASSIVTQTPNQNGIYDVVDIGSLNNPWILMRSADFDSIDDNLIDAQVLVLEGASQLLPTTYIQNNKNILKLGIDPLEWQIVRPVKGILPCNWDYYVATLAARDALIPSLIPGNKVLVDVSAATNNRWTIWLYQGQNQFSLERMQAWDTNQVWYLVDWYASGISADTLIGATVATLADRDTLVVDSGTLVKVLNTGNGRWNLFEYTPDSETLWTVVGVQNGNLQLSDNLYDYEKYSMGFSGGSYAVDYQGWEYDTRLELSYILQGLWPENNKAVGLLKVDSDVNERNMVFFELVSHVLAEQNFVDWCFKTSFINLKGFSQQLLSSAYYDPSKIDSLEKYIQEVKPYHVVIRQFVDYRVVSDYWESNSSDLDNPPYIDLNNNVSILNVSNPVDLAILSGDTIYKPWYDNYKASSGALIETVTLTGNGSTKSLQLSTSTKPENVLVYWNSKLSQAWNLRPGDNSIIDLVFVPNTNDVVQAYVYASSYLERKTFIGDGISQIVSMTNPITWQFTQVRWNNLLTNDYEINLDDSTLVELNFTPGVGDIVTVTVFDIANLSVRSTRTKIVLDRLACVPAEDYYSPGYSENTVPNRFVDTIEEMKALTNLPNGEIIKVIYDNIGLWSLFVFNQGIFELVGYQLDNGAADRIQQLYQPTPGMPPPNDPLLISGCAPKGTVLDGLDFNLNGRWGEPVWDGVLGWDNTSQEVDRLFDQYINGGARPQYWVFKGDGLQTKFALPQAPQAPNDLRVWVNGNLQNTPLNWTVKNWITAVDVANQGLGYSVNDILSVSGGTYTIPAQLKVVNTSLTGAILKIEVVFPGAYTLTPSGTAVQASGGSGVNATFVLRWGGTSLEFALAPLSAVAKPNIWVAEAGSTFESALGGTLDAVYDGQGLSRPHVEGNHPEELFPLQGKETLIIDVANQPTVGFGNVLSESWLGDSITDRFYIGQPVFSAADIIVSVGGILKTLGPTSDYVYDPSSNSIVFVFPPVGSVVITSFGFGGATPGLGNWSIVNQGIDYNLNDTIVLSDTSQSYTSTTVLVTAIRATAVNVNQPGSGYKVGDLLYFKYGSGTQTLVIKVDSTTAFGGVAGQITAVSIVNQGYYTQPSISQNEWYTNGTGIGGLITPQWGVASILPLTRGSYLNKNVGLQQVGVTISGGAPGTGTGFSIANYSSHIQETKTVVFDITSFVITMDQPIGANTILMTWNGVPTVSFGVNPADNRQIGLGFTPLPGDTIVILVYSSQYQSLQKLQSLVVTLPLLTYPLNLNTPNNPLSGFNPAQSNNALVYSNGKRLKPPYLLSAIGDNNTTAYNLAIFPDPGSFIQVWLNASVLPNTEYTLAGNQIIFTTAPSDKSFIYIEVADPVAQNYDYQIQGTNLLLASWAVVDGDTIVVRTWGEDSASAFYNDVWTGDSSNQYLFTNTPLEFQSVQVWLNGSSLSWILDYTIVKTGNSWYLKLGNHYTLTAADEIQAYYPTALPSKDGVAFRAVTNVYNDTQYLRLGNQDRTVLTQVLNWNDQEIFVANGDTLLEPDDKRPGVIWIEGERIEYFDKAPAASTAFPNQAVLRKINRGTLGTPGGISDKFVAQYWSSTGNSDLYPVTITNAGEWQAGMVNAYVIVDGKLQNDWMLVSNPSNAAPGFYLQFPSQTLAPIFEPPPAGNKNIGLIIFKQDWKTTAMSHPTTSVVRDGSVRQVIPGGYQWPYGGLGLQYSSTYQAQFLLSQPGSIPA